MTFRSKLVVSTIALTLTGQAVLFAYFARVTQSLAAERLQEKAVSLASNLAQTGAHGVYDENLYRSLDPLIEGLSRDPEVVSVTVHDKSGAVLAGFGGAAKERGPRASAERLVQRSSSEDGWHIAIVAPVFSPASRLRVGGEVIGSARVELTSAGLRRRLFRAGLGSLALAIGLALLGVFAVLLVTRRLLAPIDLIIEADEAAKRGDTVNQFVPDELIPRDEIGRIIRSRAAMLAALQAAQESSEVLAQNERRRAGELEKVLADLQIAREQLTHAERISLIGGLVAGVAHEINNPMTGIIGYSEMIANDAALPAQTREDAKVILQQATRCKSIVKDLTAFARKQALTKEPADLNALIQECLKLDGHQLRASAVHVELDLEASLAPAFIDRQQISQVLLNLIINARQAMRSRAEGRTLTVRTRTSDGFARMEVDDNGPGLAPENMRRVFDPFFTTKPAGEGTGLGLSVSQGIVSSHGGRIEAANLPGGGARFIVELPLAAGRTGPAAAAEPSPSPQGGGARVILVEDEAQVRKILRRMLESMGMTVEDFPDAASALPRLRSGGFQLAISDVHMPRMSGFELYGECRDGLGSARWLFITGSVSPETTQRLRETGRPVLGKPFSRKELESAVRGLLSAA